MKETLICFQSSDKEREIESLREKPINPLTRICKRLKREKDEIPWGNVMSTISKPVSVC